MHWLAHAFIERLPKVIERELQIRVMPEDSPAALEQKAAALKETLSFGLDRARLVDTLATMEYHRGNDLHGAACDLRVMRWLGAFLAAQERRCKASPLAPDFERVVDTRAADLYKVAVIVPLCNAASKLPLFLSRLRQQTLLSDGRVELVFVDRASPMDEFDRLKLRDELPPHTLYLRTRERESIPLAWNCGIAASRGEYISLLGIDDCLRPDGLAVLTDAFWIDPSSIGHVPAIYKRSLHDRVGWYDGTLETTGETEFKSRAFNRSKINTVPATLGTHLKYTGD